VLHEHGAVVVGGAVGGAPAPARPPVGAPGVQRLEVAVGEGGVEPAHPLAVVEDAVVDRALDRERHLSVEGREVADPAAGADAVVDHLPQRPEDVVDRLRVPRPGHAGTLAGGARPGQRVPRDGQKSRCVGSSVPLRTA
jgi:hypothetical protein